MRWVAQKDTISHEVRRGGKLVDLTSKEYTNPEYFARNPSDKPEPLAPYEAKRDFSRTPEPPPATPLRSGPLTFTIQKHAARRLHYDLRLEVDGVLVSWPIPQGPSYGSEVRRLAIQTEDHPYGYGTFEGTIPTGEYGGGEVIVWDAGTYTALDDDSLPDFRNRERAEGQMRQAIRKGHVRIFLNGRKLKGGWTLHRTRGDGTKSQWLFMKRRDGREDALRNVTLEDRSVFSGLSIADLHASVQPPDNPYAALRPTAEGVAGAFRAPLPVPYEPMLPTLTRDAFQSSDWLYEPKLDGFRVLAFVQDGRVHLRSRGGQAYEGRYPELVHALARQPTDAAVFDGEVVALGPDGAPSFQRLQNRAGDRDTALLFYAFDLLYLDGFDLRACRLSERKALLLAPIGGLEEVSSFDDGLSLFRAAQVNKLEGVIAKRRDSVYEPGRRVRTWLKIKTSQADEFVIAGYTTGIGRRSETLGSLILGSFDEHGTLRYAGHVGTGFDEAGLQDMLRRLRPLEREASPFGEPVPRGGGSSRTGGAGHWVEPRVVAEVKFSERTSDGRLRHPVFLRVRDDKAARDARAQVIVEPPTAADRGQPDQIAVALAALEEARETARVLLDGHELRLTNLNKVFWPADGERRPLLKRDLFRYYLQIAPFVLPHLRGRPVTMTRYPNGIEGPKFYQKSPRESAPRFVERFVAFSEHNNADDEYFVCNNAASLVWLAQLGDLELHVTHTRVDQGPDAPYLATTFDRSLQRIQQSTLNYPDFLVVDLDPYLYSGKEAPGAEPELHREGFARAREVAYWFRTLLESIGLQPFLKTTGKTGLHLYVPIARTLDYDSVRALAETLARQVERAHPRVVTTEWSVAARRGKVFLDYNMNRRSASLAAVYSPRAVAWAGVSTPLSWDELEKVYPAQFDILNVPGRVGQLGDLWQHILDARVDLSQLLGSDA